MSRNRPTRRARGVPRSRTVARRDLRMVSVAGWLELDVTREEAAEMHADRPKTRGECVDGQRPCPWASCKYHLALEIDGDTGAMKLVFPSLEIWELEHTCALDIADRGGLTLDEIGIVTNVTRERIRQIEVRGLLKLKRGLR